MSVSLAGTKVKTKYNTDMKTITVSMSGTFGTIKYILLAVWRGWRLKRVQRVPRPMEYTLEMTPPDIDRQDNLN